MQDDCAMAGKDLVCAEVLGAISSATVELIAGSQSSKNRVLPLSLLKVSRLLPTLSTRPT